MMADASGSTEVERRPMNSDQIRAKIAELKAEMRQCDARVAEGVGDLSGYDLRRFEARSRGLYTDIGYWEHQLAEREELKAEIKADILAELKGAIG